MECISGIRILVKYLRVLCLVLFILNNVEGQLNPNQRLGIEVGVPLPMLKEDNSQGQSPGRPNFGLTSQYATGASPRPTSPLIIKYEDDKSIVSPNLGVGLKESAISPSVNRNAARGPGSLLHVNEPHLDPSVQALLRHPVVTKKLQKETSSDSAVRVEKIITAHRQVVSGEIIYLDLKVIETKCAIGTLNLAACQVDSDEDPYICEVAVWRRPWLNSTKIIDEKTRCAEVENDNDFNNWNKGTSMLRWSNPIPLRMLPHFLDENQLALEAFDYVNRGSESKFKGQMVNYHVGSVKNDPNLNITTVDMRIEYGFTLCLKFPNRKVDDRICPVDSERDNYICSVTVMSDPHLTTNLKVVPDDDDDIDCDKKSGVEEELVVPVKAVCMGCPQSASLNDPLVLKVAEFAVIEYDRTSDESELHAMVKLHKAQSQVTNGMKYFLTLELAETDCRKPLSAVNMNRTLCNHDLTEETQMCEVIVLEMPWQKTMELVSSKCYDKNDYPTAHRDEFIVPVLGAHPHHGASGFVANPTVGGVVTPSPSRFTAALVTNPGLPGAGSSPSSFSGSQSSINFVVDEFNRQEVDDSDDGFYKLLKVVRSTTSNERIGTVDHVVIELGETICTRRVTHPNCPLKIGEDVEVCSASVLKGTPNVILSLSCDDKDDHYRLTMNPVITPYQPVHQPFFTPKPETVGAPGGPIQQQTNDSKIFNIAQFVVDQYNFQSDEDELYKLNKIISVFTQVSGNVIYTLELELLETECKKYQPVADVSKCPVEHWQEAEICQAEVAVSFAGGNGGKESRRLTRIFCDDREDFYVKKISQINGGSRTSHGGWKAENTSSDKVKSLGEKVADEFDFRSDEDNIFILFKVLESRSEATGLTHILKVELAETVCPKYKQGINKDRCVIDIGEEHKVCDAEVVERPWKNDQEVSNLRCFERDDSKEFEDESREILYRRVHPSAHARPKFIQSRFRARQHSKESDESNEKYYNPGGMTSRYGHYDSDEGHRRHSDSHVNARTRFGTHQDRYDRDDDDDDRDSDHRNDKDSRSYEHRSRFRSRRSIGGNSAKNLNKRNRKSVMTGAPISVNTSDARVKELADISIHQLDQSSNESQLRRVEEVLSASRKVVSGLLWSLELRVIYTQCKKDVESPLDLSVCEPDLNQPKYICTLSVLEKLWIQFREVQDFSCVPESLSRS